MTFGNWKRWNAIQITSQFMNRICISLTVCKFFFRRFFIILFDFRRLNTKHFVLSFFNIFISFWFNFMIQQFEYYFLCVKFIEQTDKIWCLFRIKLNQFVFRKMTSISTFCAKANIKNTFESISIIVTIDTYLNFIVSFFISIFTNFVAWYTRWIMKNVQMKIIDFFWYLNLNEIWKSKLLNFECLIENFNLKLLRTCLTNRFDK